VSIEACTKDASTEPPPITSLPTLMTSCQDRRKGLNPDFIDRTTNADPIQSASPKDRRQWLIQGASVFLQVRQQKTAVPRPAEDFDAQL
jgi:hypothetical protein